MNLTQIEREYLIKQTGVNLALNDMRERLYHAAGATGTGADLEKNWLRIRIVALGGTPNGNYLNGLWKQLVSVASLPVTNSLEENRRTYWIANPA